MRYLPLIALLLLGRVAFASPSPDPCSLTSTAKDAQLSIAIPGGRTSFREGEIVPITLSFSSTADKRYWADDRNYDRSGRLNTETYCVEPFARDPLTDYFRTGGFIGGGLGQTVQLSKTPFMASAELNEWRQPAPGHYRLYVVSSRAWRPPDPGEPTPYGRVSLSLRSNTIEFEVVKADRDWQDIQLQKAASAYQHAAGEEQRKAARELRFLNTKSSAQTLAKLFEAVNDPHQEFDLMLGLVGSPYRADAIADMQREIANPAHPITQQFLYTLTRLQIGADAAWDPPVYDPAHPENSQEYGKKRQAHERDLMRAALSTAIAALPRKTGDARATTVWSLAQYSDLLAAPAASRIRAELISEWADLPDTTKQDLLQYRWYLVAGPQMLPLLKEFVSLPAPPFRTPEATARDAALQHIFDLDAAEGRALILRDLRDPKAQPSLSLVKLLSADDLQPVVKNAVARVEKNDARELDYHVVQLFADDSALAGMKTVFNDNLGHWACEAQTALLRYFLKHDSDFGFKAASASLAVRKETGCYNSLFKDLGDALPKVEPLAIYALNDSDPGVVSDAAAALGHWGTAAAEPALWARLDRFHKEWQGREAELIPRPPYTDPSGLASTLEQALVRSIATGTNWICGSEKLERLSALASPRQKIEIATWTAEWAQGSALILPNWYPEDALNFDVLQYSDLDEQRFKTKLSQLPGGTKLYFQFYKEGQIAPPVTMEKQQAVFEALRSHAAQFGVTIEQQRDP